MTVGSRWETGRAGSGARRMAVWNTASLGAIFLVSLSLALRGFERWEFAVLGLGMALGGLLLVELGWVGGSGWWKGSLGERRVAEVLRRLEPHGFRVHHDVQIRRGNIDHVVIGPTGVFVLETKYWAGRFAVSNGRLVCDGRVAEKVLRQAVRAALDVKDALLDAGIRVYVYAVIVSVGPLGTSRALQLQHVRITSLSGLEHLVLGDPRVLSPAKIEQIDQAIRRWRGHARGRRVPIRAVAAAIAAVGLLALFRGAWRPNPCEGAVDWTEASSCVGRWVEVRGPVISVRRSGQYVYLNVGADFGSPKPRFAVRIGPAVPLLAAERFAGRTVAVEGVVQLQRDGTPEVRVETLAGVEVSG